MLLVTIILVQIIFTISPKNTRTQHIRNQTESQQRDETTNAERHRVRPKWTQEMNAALIDSRAEAEQLSNPSDFPKKENGRKMELWNSRSEFSTRKDTPIYKKPQEIYEINMQI